MPFRCGRSQPPRSDPEADRPCDSPTAGCVDMMADQPGPPSWTVAEVREIIARTNPEVIQELCDRGVTVIAFETAFDSWKYDDGRQEETELGGLRGNTVKPRREIRLRSDMTNEEAASTLFHEMGHIVRPQATTRAESLQEESDVRVETEEFRIRQGMPRTAAGYRTADGQVDREFIQNQILNSPHYNPQGRKRIGRRYVGEEQRDGWCPPP